MRLGVELMDDVERLGRVKPLPGKVTEWKRLTA